MTNLSNSEANREALRTQVGTLTFLNITAICSLALRSEILSNIRAVCNLNSIKKTALAAQLVKLGDVEMASAIEAREARPEICVAWLDELTS